MHSLSIFFDDRFRFKTLWSGLMSGGEGFDGTFAWTDAAGSWPHVVSHSTRDLNRLSFYVMSGQWASPKSPVEIDSVSGDTCTIRCADAPTTATLTLDHTTHLPQSLTYWGDLGSENWTYRNYAKRQGVQMPSDVALEEGNNRITYSISSVKFLARSSTDFGVPTNDLSGFQYDTSISPDVAVYRHLGYLFVKPLVNGHDEGWFFVDTGAEVMVIDPSIATKYHAKVVGHESTAGVVGSVSTDFVRGLDLQLGPAKIGNCAYMALDLSEFSKALGIKLGGICGFDFLARVSLDIDPAKATIGIYPPGKAPLPDGSSWTCFGFHGNVPSLNCQFEGGHDGLFFLDTGSDSNVDFFSPAVKKYQLLKDRKVVSASTGGAGGAAESKRGKMDYFVLGPKRFEKPTVGFQIANQGEFSSPFSDGNIGMGFMGQLHMVLDYQNYRIALVEKKPAKL